MDTTNKQKNNNTKPQKKLSGSNAKGIFFKLLRDYALVTAASLVMSISTYFFMLPCKLVGGGIAGISQLVYYTLGFSVSYVSIILQAPLLIWGIIKLKPNFAIKTVYNCLMYSLFMSILEKNFTSPAPQSTLLWLVFGGVLIGASITLAYWGGGSNGGSEIISNIVVKSNPDAKIGSVLIIFNYGVYTLALICFGIMGGFTLETVLRVLYSLIMSYVVSFAADQINNGVDPMLEYHIVTKKAEELAPLLTSRFKRGVTQADVIDSKGNVSDRKVLITVIQFRQNNTIKHIIKKYDPECFAYCKPIFGVINRPNFNRRYKT